MEDVTPPEGLLPALARSIGQAFPELKGRSIAVSEIDPFLKTNMPTLPIAIVALIRELGNQSSKGGGRITLEDDVLIQFAFKPVKYKSQSGNDSPFYAYYDYETIRDRVLAVTHYWRSPRNVGLQYRGLDVESDEFATWIALRFSTSEVWCPPPQDAPPAANVVARLIAPKSVCYEPCPEEPDPCYPRNL